MKDLINQDYLYQKLYYLLVKMSKWNKIESRLFLSLNQGPGRTKSKDRRSRQALRWSKKTYYCKLISKLKSHGSKIPVPARQKYFARSVTTFKPELFFGRILITYDSQFLNFVNFFFYLIRYMYVKKNFRGGGVLIW